MIEFSRVIAPVFYSRLQSGYGLVDPIEMPLLPVRRKVVMDDDVELFGHSPDSNPPQYRTDGKSVRLGFPPDTAAGWIFVLNPSTGKLDSIQTTAHRMFR
jgi:hypothetical protein